MNKIINIKSNKAIKEIREFRDKLFAPCDVKFTNVHMRELNTIIKTELFMKNDLYINSTTLWEIMHPEGGSGSHNYHELMPEDIFNALNNLCDPQCVIKVKNERYAVIPAYVSSFTEPLMVIIELNSGLILNKNANVNKIVTIYPKSNLNDYLEKLDEKEVLYKKNEHQYRLQLP